MAPKTERQVITVTATVKASPKQVWDLLNGPQHIIRWNNASEDWLTSFVDSDFVSGGEFLFRMEARDGSAGFNLTGRYDKVTPYSALSYTLADGRKVNFEFTETAEGVRVTESFEAEELNPAELQRAGWQAILDNFKKYVESYGKREIMHFEITVRASAQKVYSVMLKDKTYRQWTSVFNPTSRFSGSWEKGSTIRFLGTDAEGREGGMISRIRENIPGRFVSIEHLGEIVDGRDVTEGERIEAWRGMLENYSFVQSGDKTQVSVDIDVPHEFREYFSSTWPQALEKLKSLCE